MFVFNFLCKPDSKEQSHPLCDCLVLTFTSDAASPLSLSLSLPAKQLLRALLHFLAPTTVSVSVLVGATPHRINLSPLVSSILAAEQMPLCQPVVDSFSQANIHC